MDNRQQAGGSPPRARRAGGKTLPTFEAASFSTLLQQALPVPLELLLREHVRKSRWFRGKARSMRALEIFDVLPLGAAPDEVVLIVVRVSYVVEDPEVYVLPLAYAPDASAESAAAGDRQLFELERGAAATGRGVVYDPSGDQELSRLLLETFVRAQTAGARGRIRASPTETLTSRVGPSPRLLAPHQAKGEQSNTTIFFGQEFMLKLFRLLEAGENPDVELNEFLWGHGYRHVPEPLGSVRYESPGFIATLGIAQRFVVNQGTAWDVTLDILQDSFDRARSIDPRQCEQSLPNDDLLESADAVAPDAVRPLVEPYAAFATRLGERTAELHLALASDADRPAFTPEPFTADDCRSLGRAARARVDQAFALLARQLSGLPDEVRPLAEDVLACRAVLGRSLDSLDAMPLDASRIRCHGDYHLGQVLYGDGDFTMIDFEGEPAQPLEIRREKGSALYDVCGMLRSFHYAGTVAQQSDRWRSVERSTLACWCDAWYRWTSATFLSAYLKTARAGGQGAVFLPRSLDELRALLRLHLIDKCSYELSYELNNRPAWVSVPMMGLLSLARAH